MNNLQQARANENLFNLNVQRSDRFRISDEGYFYQTREGEIRGPFATLSAASYDLNCFIEIAELAQEFQVNTFLMAA